MTIRATHELVSLHTSIPFCLDTLVEISNLFNESEPLAVNGEYLYEERTP